MLWIELCKPKQMVKILGRAKFLSIGEIRKLLDNFGSQGTSMCCSTQKPRGSTRIDVQARKSAMLTDECFSNFCIADGKKIKT